MPNVMGAILTEVEKRTKKNKLKDLCLLLGVNRIQIQIKCQFDYEEDDNISLFYCYNNTLLILINSFGLDLNKKNEIANSVANKLFGSLN